MQSIHQVMQRVVHVVGMVCVVVDWLVVVNNRLVRMRVVHNWVVRVHAMVDDGTMMDTVVMHNWRAVRQHVVRVKVMMPAAVASQDIEEAQLEADKLSFELVADHNVTFWVSIVM